MPKSTRIFTKAGMASCVRKVARKKGSKKYGGGIIGTAGARKICNAAANGKTRKKKR